MCGVCVQNWADMEKEYQAVQAECGELQSLLDQKDDQLCSLNQDLMDLTRRMKVPLLCLLATPLHCASSHAECWEHAA